MFYWFFDNLCVQYSDSIRIWKEYETDPHNIICTKDLVNDMKIYLNRSEIMHLDESLFKKITQIYILPCKLGIRFSVSIYPVEVFSHKKRG